MFGVLGERWKHCEITLTALHWAAWGRLIRKHWLLHDASPWSWSWSPPSSLPSPLSQCSSLSCVFNVFFFVSHFLIFSYVLHYHTLICWLFHLCGVLFGCIPTTAHPSSHDLPTAPEAGKDDRDHSRGPGQPLSKVNVRNIREYRWIWGLGRKPAESKLILGISYMVMGPAAGATASPHWYLVLVAAIVSSVDPRVQKACLWLQQISLL